MTELRYIFYFGMLVIACIFACNCFMNLYGNAANIKEIAKTKYGFVNHKIDVWSCIMFGVSVAYIIWFDGFEQVPDLEEEDCVWLIKQISNIQENQTK